MVDYLNAESVNRGAIHDNGVGDIADTVVNHNSGADEKEVPPRRQVASTKFSPGSEESPRVWKPFTQPL